MCSLVAAVQRRSCLININQSVNQLINQLTTPPQPSVARDGYEETISNLCFFDFINILVRVLKAIVEDYTRPEWRKYWFLGTFRIQLSFYQLDFSSLHHESPSSVLTQRFTLVQRWPFHWWMSRGLNYVVSQSVFNLVISWTPVTAMLSPQGKYCVHCCSWSLRYRRTAVFSQWFICLYIDSVWLSSWQTERPLAYEGLWCMKLVMKNKR
jgi:hypothetical protein